MWELGKKQEMSLSEVMAVLCLRAVCLCHSLTTLH